MSTVLIICDERRDEAMTGTVFSYEAEHVPAVGDRLSADTGVFIVRERRWRIVGDRRLTAVVLTVERP